jgi:hypothetical protein
MTVDIARKISGSGNRLAAALGEQMDFASARF